MFLNGTVVTLKDRKSHGEGEDATILQAGVCGMVVKFDGRGSGEDTYVVDFGAYGQWYCTDSELLGDHAEDKERVNKEDLLDFETPSPILPSPEGESILRVVGSDDKEPSVTIDFEKDMKKRMRELEKGID